MWDQSADKLITGSVTKHVSRHLRWILAEVDQVVARCGSPKLKNLFLRIKAKKGYNVAIVALARKILCILHHLLMNREMHETYSAKKKVEIDLDETGATAGMSIEDMIKYVCSKLVMMSRRSRGWAE